MDKPGFLYVMVMDGTASLKIGLAHDIEDRRRSLQIGSPRKITILHSEYFDRYGWASWAEREAHRLLSDQRADGEWFNCTFDQAVSAIRQAKLNAPQGCTWKGWRIANRLENDPPCRERQSPPQPSVLLREIELLHERLAEKDELVADLREDRDRWREQATRLLPAPQPAERRGWWPWRRGK